MSLALEAAHIIKQKAPGFTPKVGFVLGSGLGALADSLQDKISIPYSELPGFPNSQVKGHGGVLSLGYLENVPVICLQGRAHSYEGDVYECIRTYVRCLKHCGCEIFFATNASGSLREDMPPGSLMIIEDHINLQPGNPLAGPNDDSIGLRFQPMDNAYDPTLRQALQSAAKDCNITVHQGVYLSLLGPCYETAAEIRAFKILGSDAVGMSTVPEVMVARHCGLRVAAVATITNYATGLAATSHSHDSVVATANAATSRLIQLIKQFIATL